MHLCHTDMTCPMFLPCRLSAHTPCASPSHPGIHTWHANMPYPHMHGDITGQNPRLSYTAHMPAPALPKPWLALPVPLCHTFSTPQCHAHVHMPPCRTAMPCIHIQQGVGVLAAECSYPKEELIEITLQDDVLKVDGNFVAAWSTSLSFTTERVGKTLIGSAASGEGLVNVYQGTGKLWLMPAQDCPVHTMPA